MSAQKKMTVEEFADQFMVNCEHMIYDCGEHGQCNDCAQKILLTFAAQEAERKLEAANRQEVGGFIVTLDELLDERLRKELGIDETSNVQTAFMRLVEKLSEVVKDAEPLVEALEKVGLHECQWPCDACRAQEEALTAHRAKYGEKR